MFFCFSIFKCPYKQVKSGDLKTIQIWINQSTPKSALLSFTILYLDLIEFSICRLLRGLAIFDGLFLLAAILSFGLPTLSTWFNDVVFMRIMATLFGLLHTFRTGSVYITLGVTFERFYSIVCPLRHNRYVIKMPKWTIFEISFLWKHQCLCFH